MAREAVSGKAEEASMQAGVDHTGASTQIPAAHKSAGDYKEDGLGQYRVPKLFEAPVKPFDVFMQMQANNQALLGFLNDEVTRIGPMREVHGWLFHEWLLIPMKKDKDNKFLVAIPETVKYICCFCYKPILLKQEESMQTIVNEETIQRFHKECDSGKN